MGRNAAPILRTLVSMVTMTFPAIEGKQPLGQPRHLESALSRRKLQEDFLQLSIVVSPLPAPAPTKPDVAAGGQLWVDSSREPGISVGLRTSCRKDRPRPWSHLVDGRAGWTQGLEGQSLVVS